MTTIFHPDHPHYAVHKAFVDGSFENPDAPPFLQVDWGPGWEDSNDPRWVEHHKYRLKPRTITRTVTYPEPLRDVPAMGTKVWIVDPFYAKTYPIPFEGAVPQIMALKNGMVFATEADAQSCYDALFGEQK